MEPKEDNETTITDPQPVRKPRGFAALKARGVDISAIASKGGKAAHAAGTAHRFTPEEAKAAGTKGGNAPHKSRGGKRKKSEVTEQP